MVPLASLVAVREGVAPRELNHFAQRRSATITANLAPDYAIGDALKSIEEAARRVLPPGLRARLQRHLARVPRFYRRPVLHVPARARVHLPRAVGAVRELPRSVHHHADGAAVDDRRAARAEALRRHAQRLQPDRPGDAGRPDHQARHPDRGVRQPAAGERPVGPRGGRRVGGAATAADPDDHRRDGAGRDSARARARRRGREPPADRVGDRGRDPARHGADPVRGADGLQPDRPPSPAARGGGERRRPGRARPGAKSECDRSSSTPRRPG